MRKALIILGELSDADVGWLGRVGTPRTLPPGTVLIEIGRPIENFYILLEGIASVIINDTEIARLSSGEVLGEISLIDSRAPTATVRAKTQVTVLAVAKAQLAAKLREDVGFAARFYRAMSVFLADRLRDAVTHLGYGIPTDLSSPVEAADELDLGVLDRVHIAGAKFDQLLKRLLPDYGAKSEGR